MESCRTRAWLWPRRRPQQGSCGGTAVVPGKDLAGGLVALLAKDLAEDRCLLILI